MHRNHSANKTGYGHCPYPSTMHIMYLPPKQGCQSTEGKLKVLTITSTIIIILISNCNRRVVAHWPNPLISQAIGYTCLDNDSFWVTGIGSDHKFGVITRSTPHNKFMKLLTKQTFTCIPHIIAVTDHWHNSIGKLLQHVAESIQLTVACPCRHGAAHHASDIYNMMSNYCQDEIYFQIHCLSLLLLPGRHNFHWNEVIYDFFSKLTIKFVLKAQYHSKIYTAASFCSAHMPTKVFQYLISWRYHN